MLSWTHVFISRGVPKVNTQFLKPWLQMQICIGHEIMDAEGIIRVVASVSVLLCISLRSTESPCCLFSHWTVEARKRAKKLGCSADSLWTSNKGKIAQAGTSGTAHRSTDEKYKQR
jgi:hypothetical protein